MKSTLIGLPSVVTMQSLLGCAILFLASCQTMPRGQQRRAAIVEDSQIQLKRMITHDPSLAPMLSRAAGYAVFPEVGKGGLVVGGAFGRGAIYERGGTFTGYATIRQASVGGVAGGQMYTQLVVFQDQARLDSFKGGDRLRFGAQATAVATTEGAASTTTYDNGVAVFILPRGGLMADASVSGQEFRFVEADVEEDKVVTATLTTE
jgi:lipid-binding SYLF domain-containing protein